MNLGFPGVTVSLTAEALVLHSEFPLHTLASAVVGGGFTHTRCVINRHVHKDYDNHDPAGDLLAFAREHGIAEPFVGLMTAVRLNRTRAVTLHDGDLTVAVVLTAGVSNLAAPGLSPPAAIAAGTINLVLLVDADLTPAAMVNAVITATEVKTHLLLDRGVRTPEGHPATGTSTDAVVVACTGRGNPLPYAGPATHVGWLIGQSVRQALERALG